MSVMISVFGANHESDEYQAALKLKKIIQDGLPQNAIGEIVLFVSATLMGQEVKDIDLLMMGILQNCTLKLNFNNLDDEYVSDRVEVGSFCTTIEIKSHSISGISRQGTDFYVKYGEGKHCVTEQSNQQKFSTMNFYKRILSYSPYITNVIWFTEATRNDIKDLLQVDSKEIPSNVLGNEFSLQELIQLLVWQKKPYKVRSGYRFDSNYGNCSVNDLQKALQLFSRTKESMGELTRKRIEQISDKAFDGNPLPNHEGKMAIYRGRAGTGKTVGLIQTSIKLVDEEQARVIILTYNRALVSDIKRLFSLAELPDMFEESCVSINTMQSFFFKLVNQSLYGGKLGGDEYLDRYDEILEEIIDFLDADEDALTFIKELCNNDCYLNWNYVLIDEAQDWTSKERDLILRLFDKGHIIVADGGQQFVRNVDVCDWTIVQDRVNIKLKYCLRQKNNLIKFLNHYSELTGKYGSKMLASEKLPGGKIIVVEDKSKLFDIHRQEMKKLIEVGNIAYDMLYLVPNTMVVKNNRNNYFKFTDEYEKEGIFFWDGTNEENRNSYSIQPDEIRLLQYDSSRGLEAWTVCCLDFDVFLESKKSIFDVEKSASSLLLESLEERKNKYLLNWAMIPMTRAIDTLIITLANSDSEIGRALKKISEECKDYVTWV